MKKTKTPCPTCGTCPTCGAAKPTEVVRYIYHPYPVYTFPYYPQPIYTPYVPTWPVITCGSLGSSGGFSRVGLGGAYVGNNQQNLGSSLGATNQLALTSEN